MITSATSATTAATSLVGGWAVWLGVGGALVVIGLLIALELLGTERTRLFSALQTALRVVVAPLLIVFAVSVMARALSVLAS